MALNIKNGDIAVIDGVNYGVKFIAKFDGWGSTFTFNRQAKKTATIKRRPETVVEGERGALADVITVKCTHPDPITEQIAIDAGLKFTNSLRESFAADSTGFVRLILEEKNI